VKNSGENFPRSGGLAEGSQICVGRIPIYGSTSDSSFFAFETLPSAATSRLAQGASPHAGIVGEGTGNIRRVEGSDL
jgi:hypothetical protein